MKMKTWINCIQQAINNLGGEARFAEICEEVKQIRTPKLPPTWKAIINKNLSFFSSDTKDSKGIGIFYKKERGVWGLRENKLKSNNLQKDVCISGQTSDGITKEQYKSLGEKIEKLLKAEVKLLSKDKNMIDFLKCNKIPKGQKDITTKERIFYLLVNRLKNWANREQAKKDGGVARKRKFKSDPKGECIVCANEFKRNDEIVFHHELRDGRRPIPLHTECHNNLRAHSKKH